MFRNRLQITLILASLLTDNRKNTGGEDAIFHVLNTVYSHLETPGTCVCFMFYAFSSALNTIQLHLLTCKLMKMTADAYVNSVDIKLLYESPSVCQISIRSYIRSCVH